MDVINIGRSRRFLKERPIRVTLFDRPRLVCDLICLEAGQTEKRRGLDTSDSLYVVVEGTARLTSGAQIEELQAQDAALIPPGVDHTIENSGSERLTVMALVTPKPARAGEVRMPVEGRPRGRSFREEQYERPPEAEAAGEAPRERPARPFTPRPPRGREQPYRETRPQRPPARAPRAARPAEGEAEGPAWFPRPKPAWRPRGGPPARPGGRPPYPRGTSRGPAPRREGADERESLPEERPRRARFTGPPAEGAPRPAPRGRTGGRPPAGGRGGAPRGAPRGRGGPPGQAGEGGERPRGRGAARGAGSPRPAPRGSRPSGPRGQGRSGPRTSGRRPAP